MASTTDRRAAGTAVAAVGAVAVCLLAASLTWCGGDGDAVDGSIADAPLAPLDRESATAEDAPMLDGAACLHPDVSPTCKGGWCEVPAGCFTMGSPVTEWARGKNSELQHEVTLTHPFILQQLELTVAQWEAVGWASMNSAGDTSAGDCMEPQCPAANMTWYDAVRFANDLSVANGLPACYDIGECSNPYDAVLVLPQCSRIELLAKSPYECDGFRLPTDAEWEYAARAGTTTAFYSGDVRVGSEFQCEGDPKAEEIGWFCFNTPGSPPLTQHGGMKTPNAWGFFDMSGNAYEWIGDPYSTTKDASPVLDPWAFPKPGDHLLRRGGAAFAFATAMRSAARAIAAPNQHWPALGLRLARTLHAGEVGKKWTPPIFARPDGGTVDASGQ